MRALIMQHLGVVLFVADLVKVTAMQSLSRVQMSSVLVAGIDEGWWGTFHTNRRFISRFGFPGTTAPDRNRYRQREDTPECERVLHDR
jgi:hypothetical protein